MTSFGVIQNLILFTPVFSILIKPFFLGADGGTFVCHEGAIVSKEVHIMFNPNSISSAISNPSLDQQTQVVGWEQLQFFPYQQQQTSCNKSEAFLQLG
jgi:hypothetical protein